MKKIVVPRIGRIETPSGALAELTRGEDADGVAGYPLMEAG